MFKTFDFSEFSFLSFVETDSKVNLKNSTWEQCREIVLINLAPKILHFLLEKQLKEWCRDLNFEIMLNDKTHPVSLYGIKR